MTWTDGYISEFGYTHGYYRELNPLNVSFALAMAGLKSPRFSNICELGFGQGINLNYLAASERYAVYGTDFNPSMAAFALEVSQQSGLNANIYDESFADFTARSDLPKFELILLHGIWSWVSDSNRLVISKFIREKLAPGGVVYFGYNALPGWTDMLPIREILLDVVKSTPPGASHQDIIKAATGFITEIFEHEPLYLAHNPNLKNRFETIIRENFNYLAHEFLNRDWCPMTFGQFHELIRDAKVNFGAPAEFLDHVPTANFTSKQINFLSNIKSLPRREMAKDILVNQVFRKDYWVKGARKLSPEEQRSALLSTFVCLNTDVEFQYTFARNAREVNLDRQIYEAVLSNLSDYKPHKIEELQSCINKDDASSFNMLLEVLCVLHGCGFVAITLEDVSDATVKKTQKLNRWLIDKIPPEANYKHICSPRTGAAIALDWVGQLFAYAVMDGHSTSDQLGDFAWQRLKLDGRRLQRNGEVIDDDEGNLKELQKRASIFLDEGKFKLLKAHKVLPRT